MSDSEDTPLRFSLRRKEKPIILEDENGQEKQYVMRDMDGSQRDAWQDDFSSRLSPTGKDDKGNTMFKITKWSGMHSGLIKRVVFDPEKKKYIEPATINSWPGDVVQSVYEECRKFCGLDKESEEEAKNDSKESG